MRTIRLDLADVSLELHTDRGVFSADRVDSGTVRLLRAAPPPAPGSVVLDLGCGYGPIALALAARSPSATVWAVDVNERALALTRDNAARNHLDNIVVARPQDVPEGTRFDAVYANPPVRIGKVAMENLLVDWLARLTSAGRAYLVVHRNLGGETLQRRLTALGYESEKVAAGGGYRVLSVSPRRTPAGALDRWLVGEVRSAGAGAGDGVLGLDLDTLRGAGPAGVVLGFNDLWDGPLPLPAREVAVAVPVRRGARFFEVLEWLVCSRLGVPGESAVTWSVPQRLSRPLREVLAARGWELTERRGPGGEVGLQGRAPAPGSRPEPQAFEAPMAGRTLTLAADWGVFGSGELDAGTSLLFVEAVERPPVETVLDVGCGYGALAVGMVVAGAAQRAVGTEVDAVALVLAAANARRHEVALTLVLDDDPTSVGTVDRVVCNLPTHAPAPERERLLAGLARLAETSEVLVVVHASLEDRYRAAFAAAGVDAEPARRSTHAVLELRPRARPA